MDISVLDIKHPTYDAETCRRYDALYRGGGAFRDMIDTFLLRNPDEPDSVYSKRRREAYFRSYAGPIVDFFVAKLFSAALIIRAKRASGTEDTIPDQFYSAFKEDVDGAGTDFVDFVRARFASACVKGRAWWVAELPDNDGREPLNRAEWQERDLGRVVLCPIENEQVFDWEVDERGRLLWAIVYSSECRRDDPFRSRSTITETWKLYDREYVETFVAERRLDKPRPEKAESKERKLHGFRRVPLISLGFLGTRGLRVTLRGKPVAVSPSAVEGLWVLNRIADAQIEHFRLSCARSWNLKRTCFAMPVFRLKERRPPTMGAGYFIMVGEGEDVTWAAPPTAHLQIMGEAIADEKEEIYRVAQQMSQGVENNAAAIGRSGESKAVDSAAIDVCLRVYGALCKGPIEDTLELVAEARNETDIAWHVEGLDTFNLSDATATVENAVQVAGLNIPSATFQRALFERVAAHMLPNADQTTLDAIRSELLQNVSPESIVTTGRDELPPLEDQPDGNGAVAEASGE